jgi:hypothetical protein
LFTQPNPLHEAGQLVAAHATPPPMSTPVSTLTAMIFFTLGSFLDLTADQT